jgi:hypothetical protein
MFDAGDWIDRLMKAGGRIEIDWLTMHALEPVSAECLAIWNEIRPPAAPDRTGWKAVEAELRRRVGDVGAVSFVYPDDVSA